MMLAVKRWVLVFGTGLVIGIVVGQHSTFMSIIDDCKVMGMFRVGKAPISCTYHLVKIPNITIEEKPEPQKGKKK